MGLTANKIRNLGHHLWKGNITFFVFYKIFNSDFFLVSYAFIRTTVVLLFRNCKITKLPTSKPPSVRPQVCFLSFLAMVMVCID
jgi:hypothetical protein